jgi:hypothetical protein
MGAGSACWRPRGGTGAHARTRSLGSGRARSLRGWSGSRWTPRPCSRTCRTAIPGGSATGKRTFQRRVNGRRYGSGQGVIFRQVQNRVGRGCGLPSKDIAVTIGGVPGAPSYHFAAGAASGGAGRESFSALAEGLQEALWRLGGHRRSTAPTASAAYKPLARSPGRPHQRYEALCAHYGMTATRNNRGVSRETVP